MKLNFKNHRVHALVILKSIRLYIKYKLSLRDVAELLEIGINVSRESIRKGSVANNVFKKFYLIKVF